MTSHRTNSSKMQASAKEKKKDSTSTKEKSNATGHDKPLPLLRKSVYMDVKNAKQTKVLEEQLKRLGATVEKFLSREVNYVISSFGPIKQEERPSTGDDNPQSPSFVPSPFNCGPSPTASTDPKKNLVSRGKALAQIAAKNQTPSTVIASAEKLGIKVVSVEVASKWLDKELKKIEKEHSKGKKENSQERLQKAMRKKKKFLKGAYIKFEACNQMYRPIKSELDRWPKVNPLAPPGLNPFTEVKMKIPHVMNVRRQLLLRNKRTSCPGILSTRRGTKKSFSKSLSKDSGASSVVRNAHGLPDLFGVPITTTGDIKRNMENHWKKRPDKLQGYCECCEEKYKDLNQHLHEEEHRLFARNKLNYESLDVLIAELPPAVDFLQNLVLQHCSQKQIETQLKTNDKQLRDALPALNFVVASPVSSIKTGLMSQEDIVALEMCTPQPDHEPSSNLRSNSDPDSGERDREEKPDKRPQAVVIRRPTPSGIFTSPRRRQPTPSKKPWVQERCMVFRDSPMASLQPSTVFSQINFTVSESVLANPYSDRNKDTDSKQPGSGRKVCEKVNEDIPLSVNEEFSTSSICGSKTSVHQTDSLVVRDNVNPACLPENTQIEPKANSVVNSVISDKSGPKAELKPQDSKECVSGEISCNQEKNQKSARPEENLNLDSQETISVPCIADRVKTRTRKNVSGEKVEGKEKHLSSGESPLAVSDKKTRDVKTVFDTISSGKSFQDKISNLHDQISEQSNTKNTKNFQDILGVRHKCDVPNIEINKRKEIDHPKSKSSATRNELESNEQSLESTASCDAQHENSEMPILHREDQCDSTCLLPQNKNKSVVNSSAVDDSPLPPKRKKRKMSNDVSRVLFADSSHEEFVVGKTDILSPVKAMKRKQRSETHESTDTVCTERNPLTECDGQLYGPAEEKNENKNKCFVPENVTSTSMGKVRQCRLFVHEGMYKEGASVVSNTGHERRLSSTPSKKKCQAEIKSIHIPALPNFNVNVGDSNTGSDIDSERENLKNVQHKISKPKSYEKKIRTSVNWNTTNDEKLKQQHSEELESSSQSNLIVPNIAERVKRRRSCTQFNHEGQYANGGEGTEETTPKPLKLVNRQRKFLKAKRKLWSRLGHGQKQLSRGVPSTSSNFSETDSTDMKIDRTETEGSSSKKKRLSDHAVVIRRGKPFFNNLSKSDANWCKYLSDKDWSQCETEDNSSVSLDESNGNLPSTTPAESFKSQTSSNVRENQEPAKPSKSCAESPLSFSKSSHRTRGEEMESKEGRMRRKSLQKAIKNLQMSKTRKSQNSLPYGSNLTGSPRLRLRIQKNPIDESYSSTLEEIYDEKPGTLRDPSCSYQAGHHNEEVQNTLPSGGEEFTIQHHNQHVQLVTKQPKQSQSEVKADFHAPDDRNIGSRRNLGYENEDLSLSSNKGQVEGSGSKSVRGRLKLRRSHSSKHKSKIKLEVEEKGANSNEGQSNEDDSRGTKGEGRGENVEDIKTKSSIKMKRVEKNSEDASGCMSESQIEKCEEHITTTTSCNSVFDNTVKEDVAAKTYSSNETKSQKSANKISKGKKHRNKREHSLTRDDSSLPAKKAKLSNAVSDDSFSRLSGNGDDSFSHQSGNDHGIKASESDTTEVDFPNLYKTEETEQSKVQITSLVEDSEFPGQNTPPKLDRCERNDKSCDEEHQSDFIDNIQPPNLGDLLAFVPTFSSPGKTNSSWDDACDSYLNTSAKLDNTSTNPLNTSNVPFSPTPFSHNLNKTFSSTRSPGKRTPKKPIKRCFSPEVLAQFTSPTKKKGVHVANLEMSPVIEQVDSVISFNHMSPQRLQFSPMKCEKSVSHRRNLNSPSK